MHQIAPLSAAAMASGTSREPSHCTFALSAKVSETATGSGLSSPGGW